MTAFSALYFSSTPSCPQLLKSPPKSLIKPHLACLSLPRSKQINVVGRSSAFRPKMVLTPGPGSDIKPLRFSLAFGASISKREKFSPVSGEEKETRFEIDISTPLLAAPKQSNSLQSQTFLATLVGEAANTLLKRSRQRVLFPSRILSNLIPWIFSVPTVWSGISKIGGGSDGGVGGSSGGDGIEGSIGAVETGLAPSAQPLDPLDFETSEFSFVKAKSNGNLNLVFDNQSNFLSWTASISAMKMNPAVYRNSFAIISHMITQQALEAADNSAPTSHDLLGTSYRTQFKEPSKSVLK
ncbi:hypothetical protein Peur_062897 [Populus x canadensis]